MKNKKDLIKKFGGSEKNTGAVEVQIAILTESIKNLTNHLIKNKKDYISKKGLFIKVSQRKRLLKYLSEHDIKKYRDIVEELKLRS